MLVLKESRFNRELFARTAKHLVFLGQKSLSLFKHVRSKKELHVPVTIGFVLLSTAIVICAEQLGAKKGHTAFNMAMIKTAIVPNTRSLPSALPIPSLKKKPVSPLFKPAYGFKTFYTFKEVLGYRESGGDYGIVNSLGYLGKYQFGASTLRVLGIRDTNFFLNNPKQQETAFVLNVSRNKWILRNEIRNFGGRRVNGVLITESGIIAAAHLSGPGNVQKYLRSGGKGNVKDAYGTSLQDYMERFGGYNISIIPAIRNPRWLAS